MKMMNQKLLLKEVKKSEEKDGLFVLEANEDESIECEVVATHDEERFKTGQTVLLSKHNVNKVSINGEHFLIAFDEDVWGVK